MEDSNTDDTLGNDLSIMQNSNRNVAVYYHNDVDNLGSSIDPPAQNPSARGTAAAMTSPMVSRSQSNLIAQAGQKKARQIFKRTNSNRSTCKTLKNG